MATAILSASEASTGYKPFKCVICGSDGMAAPKGRERKFCHAPCKAGDVRNTENKVATKARKQAAKKAKEAAPPPSSKTCTKCGETKPITEFCKDSRRGLKSSCKVCHRQVNKAWADKNKHKKKEAWERVKADPNRHSRKKQQKRQAAAQAKQDIPAHEARVRLHDAHVGRYVRNGLHDAHIKARYARPERPALHDAHVRSFKSGDARYAKWRYHNVPEQALYHRLKRWMHKHLSDQLPSRKWSAHLGYTTTELRRHLERQFVKGMTWDNKGEWHIDHITPVSSFKIDSIDSDDFRACFGLHNLRPIWAAENLRKRDKIEFLL